MPFGFRFGGSGSPVEKLASGKLKDEEKQQLLGALGSSSAVEVVPLICLDDAPVANKAGQIFVTKADAEAVNELLSHLLGRTTAISQGMKVLGKVKEDLLISAFDAQLTQPKTDVARKIWELTLELPMPLVDRYLERAVREAPSPPRQVALQRLLKAKGAEALKPLLLECASNREVGVRKEALQALSTLAGDDVFNTFLERLGADDSKDVRDFASRYLQQFITKAPPELKPKVLGRLLLAGEPETRSTLVKSMFGQGKPDELLLGVLQFCKTLTGVQHKSVMEALTAVGDGLIQPTLAILTSKDADLRVQAVYLLEAFADGRTVGPLINMLRDPDWWVRIVVCETLGRMKEPMIIQSLKDVFNDPDAKWAAIEAVGRIGGDQAANALLPLLRDPTPEVRGAVVSTLKNVKDARVNAALNEVSQKDASVDVRLKAVGVLRALEGGDTRGGGMVVASKDLTKPLEKILAYTRERNGSDLHLTPGEPPVMRVNGALERIQSQKLEANVCTQLLMDALDPVRKPILEKTGAVDFCYQIPGVGRFRTNIFKMKRGLAGVFRCVPSVAPTLAELGLPKHLNDITTYHQGIVLITGPSGSGKTNTLTALINLVNETKHAHVLTFEDPVEFIHTNKKALINQREIGRDSMTYAAAMRGALREDPDVIVVGDMRDPETVRLALLASETGHLVIASMQTTGAVATIDKLVDSFPPDEQQQVRGGLSESLKMIISQVLAPRADGQGRVGIFEILKSTSPVRSLIRDGKSLQLPSTMVTGRSVGMQTLDGALEERVRAGAITFDVAMQFAQSKDQFARLKPTAGAAPAAPAAPGAPAARPSGPAGAAGAPRPSVGGAPGAPARPAAPGAPGAPAARPPGAGPGVPPGGPGTGRKP